PTLLWSVTGWTITTNTGTCLMSQCWKGRLTDEGTYESFTVGAGPRLSRGLPATVSTGNIAAGHQRRFAGGPPRLGDALDGGVGSCRRGGPDTGLGALVRPRGAMAAAK